MRKIFFIAYVFFLCVSAFPQGDTVTLRQCIADALAGSPQMKIAQGGRELSGTALTSARSGLLPQLNYTAGYAKNGGTMFIGSIARTGDYENYSTGFQLQQMLFDFGKSYTKYSAAGYTNDAAGYEYQSAKQNIILNAGTAYFGYQMALKIMSVSKEFLKQAEDHLKQASAFYAAGKKPKFDVLKAETDVATAKLNLIKSENGIRLARLQLENVINKTLPRDFIVQEISETGSAGPALQEAYETALRNRPEIQAAANRTEAGKSLLTSSWQANLPAINLTGGYGWRGLSIKEQLLKNWNVGLNLSLPVFQGFALDAGYEAAKAGLKISEGQQDAVMQSVKLEVEQQFYSLNEAAQRIEAAKTLLAQAEETGRLARARYEQEVGSPVEVTDAEATLANAKLTLIQALYDFNLSRLKLSRAMGVIELEMREN